jgi:thiamine biosynthesis protein ThiS
MIRVKGKEMEWRPGLTVEEILKETGYFFPNMQVLIDKRVVKQENWKSFIVPDGSRMDILEIIYGG